MSLITLRQLLDHAADHQYGLPAFNINNIEQVRAIMQAADACNSPVILQASAGARHYAGPQFIKSMVQAAQKEWPHIPICLHQDHGASPKICQEAMDLGFTSVMMDGSLEEDMTTPSSYEYNVKTTHNVVKVAHAKGVSVEGELGCLGSLETGRAADEDGSGAEGVLDHSMLLTDPDQARDFVHKTGVDALAIAVGTSHGAYKFSKPPSEDILAIDRIRKIHAAIPNTHLVMHGSSSVPQSLIERINAAGGHIAETYGVPLSSLQTAIRHGVRKINIDTDLRLAATAAIREIMVAKPDVFDPRAYLKFAVIEMQKICHERFEVFGSAGFADSIVAKSCQDMALSYAENKV